MPIFADYHRTVIGYHGTRRAKARAIVSGDEDFAPSTNADDWLGGGVYFWEYAPQQAWNWARRRYPGEDIAVVASMIRLGNCLDLLDPKNAEIVQTFHQQYTENVSSVGKTVPRNFNSRKFLDCAVLEFAYKFIEEENGEIIDTSRAVYVPGAASQNRLWKSSWLCHDTHVQLCVRTPQCVLGTWLAKPEGA